MSKSTNKIPPGIKTINKKSFQGPGRPKKLEREAVIKVAMNSFWQKGLEVSLNSICDIANVAKPSLYREFGNEDGLTLAALEKYFEISFGLLKDLLLGPASIKEKLEKLSSFVCEESCNQNGCLFVKMRAGSFNLGPKTQSRVLEIDQENLNLFIKFLQLSRKNGEWKSDLPDDVAARYLNSLLELAFSQRARGVLSLEARKNLDIGLSVFLDRD